MRRHFFSLKLHQSTVGSVDGADVLANAPIEARTPPCGRIGGQVPSKGFVHLLHKRLFSTSCLTGERQGSAGR